MDDAHKPACSTAVWGKLALENLQPALRMGIRFLILCSLALNHTNSWTPPLSFLKQISASLLKLLPGFIEGTGLCFTQARKALLEIPWPECSAHQTIGYRSRVCFGYFKRRKIGPLLLGKTRFVAGSKTLSLRWTDSLYATPRQGFFCRVWDLCVAFHQSWGFRAHRNQSKQPDVHRFTDTQETWFFRPKLCFSGFFPLDFSVRRNNTTVVNYLWGLGFRFFFLFHQ